ncbi:MAG: hypothetical protein IPN29_19420 [Saprospiraceae bacterium]|nr:hypothetical protein [Saprospiraceae bacterium]
MGRFFLMIVFAGFILGCNKDGTAEAAIDEALMPYFQKFEEEANTRGVNFDVVKANISGEMVNIAGNNIIAQCTHNSDEPSKVTVDYAYWVNADEFEREFYIFHELGHCYLNRSHLDSKDQSGNCISIMHSSADACRFIYNSASRKLYMDELFTK